MGFFGAMDASASGLTIERLRMDIISQNLANVDTTRTQNGTPYKRKSVLIQSSQDNKSFASYLSSSMNSTSSNVVGNGVKAVRIIEDETEGPKNYDPSHPDADADGYVTMPNVNAVTEMVNMISANRAYEANISALNTSSEMGAKTLSIGK